MRMPRPTELHAAMFKGCLKGLLRGGTSGAALSLVTGAAITVSAPAWVPFVGGALLVSGSTVMAWSVTAAAIGGVSGGTWSYVRERRWQRRFNETFNQRKKTHANRTKPGSKFPVECTHP
jgi:membrane protein DedA with SNARE-associated domain